MNRSILPIVLLLSAAAMAEPPTQVEQEIEPSSSRTIDIPDPPSSNDDIQATPASDEITDQGTSSPPGPPLIILEVPVELKSLSSEVKQAWLLCR